MYLVLGQAPHLVPRTAAQPGLLLLCEEQNETDASWALDAATGCDASCPLWPNGRPFGHPIVLEENSIAVKYREKTRLGQAWLQVASHALEPGLPGP